MVNVAAKIQTLSHRNATEQYILELDTNICFSYGMKMCSSCHKTLSKDKFNIARKRYDGCSVYCKKCTHEKYRTKYLLSSSDKICKRCFSSFTGMANAKTCGKCPRGRKPISGYKECLYCSKSFPYRLSLKVRSANGVASIKQKYCSNKCSLLHRNKSEWMRNLVKETHTGRIMSMESRNKLSIAKLGKPVLNGRGERHHWWKGGITKENQKVRSSIDISNWRRGVFISNDYTCQFCFIKGGKLHAHHQKPFSRFIADRFNLKNGVTLCEPCHKTIPSHLQYFS